MTTDIDAAEAAYGAAVAAVDAAHSELRLALKAARVTDPFAREEDPPGVVAARVAFLRASDALKAAGWGVDKARIVALEASQETP